MKKGGIFFRNQLFLPFGYIRHHFEIGVVVMVDVVLVVTVATVATVIAVGIGGGTHDDNDEDDDEDDDEEYSTQGIVSSLSHCRTLVVHNELYCRVFLLVVILLLLLVVRGSS